MFLRSPTSASGRIGVSSLVTGSDSPVSGASSQWMEWFSTSRASAGILSPASSTSTSPGTSSFDAISQFLAAAQHRDHRRQHALQGVERPLRAVFLHEAEHRAKHDDHQNDGRVHVLADKGGEDRGDDQNDDQDVLELVEEEDPGRSLFLVREFVRAVFVQTAGGLLRRKTPQRIYLKFLQCSVDIQRMPRASRGEIALVRRDGLVERPRLGSGISHFCPFALQMTLLQGQRSRLQGWACRRAGDRARSPVPY